MASYGVSAGIVISPMGTEFYDYPDELLPLRLQRGGMLAEVRLAYELYGEIDEAGDNLILLFHALTGSQHAAGWTEQVDGVERWTDECRHGWWTDFIGPGLALDTDRFAVLCVNYLGGCYGSTGPSSLDPATGRPYGSSFPDLTLADIVDSQLALLDHLGVARVHATTGASLGGMMALSLATRHPDRVRKVMPIAAGLHTTSLQFIHNFEQTNAILNDPNFNGGDYYRGAHPDRGLALARMIGHKTFVSLDAMRDRARHEVVPAQDHPEGYEIRHPLESYMWHQGMKFIQRFDANTYLQFMSVWQHYDFLADLGVEHAVDAFRGVGGQEYLVFSIDSDVCYYPEEQSELVSTLKAAGVPVRWITVHSDKGHDSFLLEPELYTPYLKDFLDDHR